MRTADIIECAVCGNPAREKGEPDGIRWVVECLFCGWYFWSRRQGSEIYGGCEFRTLEKLTRIRRRENLPLLQALSPSKAAAA